MSDLLPDSCETLIVGAGVVGLSIAYELVSRGANDVVVIDRQPPALEASWAGAGILPPGSWYDPHPALESLAALSGQLNLQWSTRLVAETGIDNQLRPIGGVHLAKTPTRIAELDAKFAEWRTRGYESDCLSAEELAKLEPGLHTTDVLAGYLVPGESKIDNRLHAAALVAALKQQKVPVCYPQAAKSLDRVDNRQVEVQCESRTIVAQQAIIATGAWSRVWGEQLGIQLRVRPIRGQMLDFEPGLPSLLQRIVHHLGQYLVPREAGRLMVGATVDDVGFDKSTNAAQILELEEFARTTLPSLVGVPIENTWAGLRPASEDGLPYIGRVPDAHNVLVAAGHYRSGLQMASATAVAVADLLAGEQPPIDLTPFSLKR
ncbi:NAD(P)/FAD-dependent oxidoreductase [Aeoliella mucimassa]|uniref:NAD(P)/FAD-dependent oxidoreductase n=1 Tax=Aeoliella mucimassa TaxID=2527972 RepID=UPI0018D41819|nr:FAD-binding oxidoreductase [Aeoliella mucimassa]